MIEILQAAASEPELGNRVLQRTYRVSIPEAVLHAAKTELLSRSRPQEVKFTPGRESSPEDYPQTSTLAELLAVTVLEPAGSDLSFIRANGRKDYIFADNLHFDSRYVGYSKNRNI
jgi:hypothetical protein